MNDQRDDTLDANGGPQANAKANDNPPRTREREAAERVANHPGTAENAAGMDNDDKGEGHRGSNTNRDLHIDNGERNTEERTEQ